MIRNRCASVVLLLVKTGGVTRDFFHERATGRRQEEQAYVRSHRVGNARIDVRFRARINARICAPINARTSARADASANVIANASASAPCGVPVGGPGRYIGQGKGKA